MEQRVSLITLGVTDVSRARAFYERLGWRGQEVQETVFFQAGGLGLVLWHQDKLADDAGRDHVHGEGFRGVNLAHNVRTRDEVDALMQAARAARATITRPPADTFYGGYAGHFSDPDGHAWEVAYNPGRLSPTTGRSPSPTSALRRASPATGRKRPEWPVGRGCQRQPARRAIPVFRDSAPAYRGTACVAVSPPVRDRGGEPLRLVHPSIHGLGARPRRTVIR